MSAEGTTTLLHAKVRLALHRLGGDASGGRPLLLLHGLGSRSPEAAPADAAAWPGPVMALDFTGHGDSDVPRGGGYTAEVLMADADAALAAIGPATVLGRGLGAYVGLLVAGARPDLVRGAVLCDGSGIEGGGERPAGPALRLGDPGFVPPPDPFAYAERGVDVRPPDYATRFVRQATHLSGREWPIWVAARARPPWLEAVVDEPGVRCGPVAEALAHYGAGG